MYCSSPIAIDASGLTRRHLYKTTDIIAFYETPAGYPAINGGDECEQPEAPPFKTGSFTNCETILMRDHEYTDLQHIDQ